MQKIAADDRDLGPEDLNCHSDLLFAKLQAFMCVVQRKSSKSGIAWHIKIFKLFVLTVIKLK